MMKRFSLQSLKRGEYMVVVAAAAFVALLGIAAVATGAGQVWEELTRLTASDILVLLAFSLFNYVLRGTRWHLFALKLRMHIPPGRLALYYTAGYAMAITPGKIGMVLRLWLIRRCHGYAYSRTAPLLFMDQITDAIAMTSLAVVGAAAFSGYGLSLAAMVAFLLGVILMFYRPRLLIRLLKGTYHLFGRRKPRLFAFAKKMIRHTVALFSPGLLTASSALSIIGWGAEVYAFWWLLNLLGAPIDFFQTMFIFAFSTVIGGISLLPGGLGSMEATMFALLAAVGVPADVAVVSTALIRLTTLWFATSIGLAVLPFSLRLAAKS